MEKRIAVEIAVEKEDLQVIFDELPQGWQSKAGELKAFRRPLEGFESARELLRGLLIHFSGLSLKETSLRLKHAGVGQISAPGLFKRLKAAEHWLQWMAQGLFNQQEESCPGLNRRVRLVDGTIVKEQGRTGSCWRLHWSMDLESLRCDFFELTDQSQGETLRRYPLEPGDLVVADAGYASRVSVRYAKQKGADLLVRLRKNQRWLLKEDGKPLDLLGEMQTLGKDDQVREWAVQVSMADQSLVQARLVGVKLQEGQFAKGVKRAKRKAQKHQTPLREETKEMRRYLMLLTTVPEGEMTKEEAVSLYRRRWQIELAFKRQKSILDMGCIPKSDPASARAWLYGKLLLGVLIERLKDRGDYLFIGESAEEASPRLQSVA